jgi:hypothetical protein
MVFSKAQMLLPSLPLRSVSTVLKLLANMLLTSQPPPESPALLHSQ